MTSDVAAGQGQGRPRVLIGGGFGGPWMATIARANRSDRSFILGGSGHPEEPYTWESPVHQGQHSARDESG